MRAPSTYDGSAANNGATSNDCAAPVNSTGVIAASVARLIVRITIAAARRTTDYNCAPPNDRSPAMNAPNCTASVHAAANGPHLHNLTVINRSKFEEVFWKD